MLNPFQILEEAPGITIWGHFQILGENPCLSDSDRQEFLLRFVQVTLRHAIYLVFLAFSFDIYFEGKEGAKHVAVGPEEQRR